MSADDRLTELLLLWEELRERGLTPTPEDLCRDCPELVGPLREAVKALAGLDPLLDTIPGASAPPAQAAEAPAAPRYRRHALHARGGLGEVFLAEDAELNRQVALKEIQPRFADQPDSRARFIREGQVTAQLEHPGIVPVYGMSRYPDGRPYYAMRFIKGESFHDAIKRFHHADDAPHRDPGERRLELRRLLGHFVAVCNAVAYAHSRGVIHRDLKPANVMLGTYGETLVVDWGLAKVLGASDESTSFHHPLTLPEPGTPPTLLGHAAGTPAFMPPEQARGEWGRVGETSDVFALGATLYCLLTGKAPYAGHDALGKAARAEAPPARQANPRVPRALEAVCRKAMAAEPEQRYATARQVAAEVERWLAGEPVTADREPLSERLGRWSRRHRTLVTSGVVLLLATVAGLGLGLAAVRAEQRQTELALEREGEEKQRALKAEANARENLERSEKNFALAKKAVDETFGIAKDHPLLNRIFTPPDLRQLRVELLKKALPFYEEFLAQKKKDRGLSDELANQHVQVGFIHVQVGNWREAKPHLAEALRVYRLRERDDRRAPNALNDEVNFTMALEMMGFVQTALGETDQARATYDEATRLARRWGKQADRAFLDRTQLAASRLMRAQHQLRAGRREEALQSLLEAVRLFRQLARANPNDFAVNSALAMGLHSIGKLQKELGRRQEALKSLSEATRHLGDLLRSQPDKADVRYLAATGSFLLGELQRELGTPGDARTSFEQSVTHWRALAKVDPDSVVVQTEFPRAIAWLGFGLKESRQLPEALAHYREAATLFRRAIKAQQGVVLLEAKGHLGNALGHVADLEASLGQRKEALVTYREATEVYRDLAKAQPQSPAHRKELARLLQVRGGLLMNLAQHQQALPLLTEALTWLDRPPEEGPAGVEHLRTRCALLHDLGLVLLHLGRAPGARLRFEEALAGCRDLTRRAQGPSEKMVLVSTLDQLGQVEHRADQYEEARKKHREAFEVALQLAREGPPAPPLMELLANTSHNLALPLLALGKREAARQSYRLAAGWRRKLVKAEPTFPGQQPRLASTLTGLALVNEQLGHLTEALGNRQQVVALRRKLAADPPQLDPPTGELARALFDLGNLEMRMSRTEPAARHLTEAIDLRGRLLKAKPNDPQRAYDLAQAHTLRSLLRRQPGQAGGALEDLGVAVRLLNEVKQRAPKHPGVDRWLLLVLRDRAILLALLNRQRDAIGDWDQVLRLAPAAERFSARVLRAGCLGVAGLHDRAASEATELSEDRAARPEDLLQLAGALAQAAAGAARDRSLPLPVRERLAESRARLGVTLLRRAAGAGLFRAPAAIALLDRAIDFGFLRDRDDYQRFRASLGNR